MTAGHVRVLVTSIGGHFCYEVVDALRRAPDFSAFVVGVDADPHARAWHVDAFAHVPHPDASEDAYLTRLLEICDQLRVEVVIPLSEAESRAVAGARRRFEERGIVASVSAAEVVFRMTDKGTMFEHLEANEVDVGPWRLVGSIREAGKALEALGYPARPVVLKQRRGSGSRGIIIVDAAVEEFTPLLPDRFCGRGAWTAVRDELHRRGCLLDAYLAMPYYGSHVFDVDCLAREGSPMLVVPRLRQYINPLSPVNEGCCVTRNDAIERYASTLTQAFSVDGVCDFDVALSDDGRPRLLDASCRLSGSVGAAVAAGVNVPAELVRLLTKRPLLESQPPAAPIQVRPVPRFVRVR
ncbi:MAG: hypothetical protein A3I61_19985 [Acidobacteria bacterium RIFCSPLOWO2_02_FULL_68_18]|nr:MAG: hypothetical protein A3I61_19985 [Acidobacteria bacterium RIFCSPLOWO2_02_FULL_68_18]OFW48256.1 MAG: hypothetical protein A3G77_03155 [Acidobacteria bacterium RIFCSPLOWO2_12_FULL_68_19]